MKICIPMKSLSESGGVKVLFKLADFLVEEGHDVIIITFKELSRKKLNFSTRGKIKYMKLNIIEKMLIKFPLLQDLIVVYRLLKDMPPCDIAIANLFLTAYPVWLSPKPKIKLYYCQAFEPKFFYRYWNPTTGFLDKIMDLGRATLLKIHLLLAKYSYHLGLYMIANNRTIVKDIKRELKKDIHIPILSPGIDTSVFKPRQKRKDKKIVVGTIASPSYWKGTNYFLEAIRILRKWAYDVKVLCAFGPPPRGSPKVENITWTNPRTQEKLAEFYCSVDIFVSPILIQNEFPLPPLEAMACKTPVICTPVIYATPNIHYYEVPAKNPRAIATAMQNLIGNPASMKKLAVRGHKLSRKFDWICIRRKFINIIKHYEQLMTNYSKSDKIELMLGEKS